MSGEIVKISNQGKLQRAAQQIYNRESRKVRLLPASLGEPISFRPSSAQLRYIDEFLAARTDPLLKTRTDVIRDAIDMWVTCAALINPHTLQSKEYVALQAERLLDQDRAHQAFIELVTNLAERHGYRAQLKGLIHLQLTHTRNTTHKAELRALLSQLEDK